MFSPKVSTLLAQRALRARQLASNRSDLEKITTAVHDCLRVDALPNSSINMLTNGTKATLKL